MEDSLTEFLVNFIGIIVFCCALAYISYIALTFIKYDRVVAADVKEKQSIVQVQDGIRNTAWKQHRNEEHTLTSEEVFSSILFTDQPDSRTKYFVNGADVSGFCDLAKAREGDENEIRNLKSRCYSGDYRVEETFKNDGSVDYVEKVVYTRI